MAAVHKARFAGFPPNRRRFPTDGTINHDCVECYPHSQSNENPNAPTLPSPLQGEAMARL